MDSSPDLSLKLRRGSSDSRDSFYMDFAQGIDSDIEEVDTTVMRTSIDGQQLSTAHITQTIPPPTSPQPPPPPPPPPPPLPTTLPPLPLSPSESESPPSILDIYSERPSQPLLQLHPPDDGSPPPPPLPPHQHIQISPEAETMSVIAQASFSIDETNEDAAGPPSAVVTAADISDTSSLILPLPPPTPLSLDER